MRGRDIFDDGPRRSGRTTLCADQVIQTLFKEGIVTIIDHHNTDLMSRHLCKIVEGRLIREHRLRPEIDYRVKKPGIGEIHFKIKLLKK